MKIEVKSTAINDFCDYIISSNSSKALLERADDLKWQIRYYEPTHNFTIDLSNYDLNDLIIIKDALRKIRARKQTKRLELFIDVLSKKDDTIITDLEVFADALVTYIDTHTEHKWIFREQNIRGQIYMVPAFVFNTYYEPEHYDRDKYYYEPYVSCEIHTNSISGYEKRKIQFTNEDVLGKTIPQILYNLNIILETPELYDEYKRNDEIFTKRCSEQRKQYKCYKYTSCSNHWSDSFITTSKVDNVVEYFHVVNDNQYTDYNIKKSENCSIYGDGNKSYELPVLPFIKCYNLDMYCDCLVHVDDIEDYVYDKSLRDKLILPQSHKELLDILVNNASILKGDIIDNKGNGTVVILEGPPGCGKTLTTEVYSELMEKPLYKISSGQLGVDAKEMDSNLYDVLRRASRLGCILLIDECETFVRKRGNDLIQNAIITTFLRKIEYFDGIMFLTSNKIKDIDDAILSRCIAAIKYEKPTEENAKKIWKVLSKQFNLYEQVNDELINTLVKVFPNAVGRDIKELLKLTARFCTGLNKNIDIQSFLTCAQFRYIDIDEHFVETLNL